MADYKLSYTGSEINEKLGKVDSLVATINGVAPDINGNVNIATGGNAIIDVVELPTENIQEGAFYRLLTAKFVYYDGVTIQFPEQNTCYCVNELPQTGESVTDMSMSYFVGYYNISDGIVYGYADSTLASAFSVSAGWYSFEALAGIAGVGFNGIITNSNDIVNDSTAYSVLLAYDFYIYKNGWSFIPFAYEKMPEFDFQWDGDSTDKFVLDMSSLGFTGISITKISDQYLTAKQLLGSTVVYNDNNGSYTIVENDIDTSTYAGGITVRNGELVSIYSADDANAGLGLPSGYLTNGLYFFYNSANRFYVSRLVAPSKITKIDSKYLDVNIDVSSLGLHSVATTGNYYSLSNRPTIYTDIIRYNTSQSLTSTNKSTARTNIDVYSKSEVDTKITEAIEDAIEDAIGGSY